MRRTVYTLLLTLLMGCSFVEQKPQVVQVDQVDGEKKQDWNKMMSGIKLETEQAIHLAVLKVENEEKTSIRGPKRPNGLVLDGEALLVPNKIIGFEQKPSTDDWEMTIGIPQMVDVLEQKDINFFVFCFKKSLCPLLNERFITMGVSPKRLNVEYVSAPGFSESLTSWLKTHRRYLFIGDSSADMRRVLSRLDRSYPIKNKKRWLSRFFISLPDARSRVAKWHNDTRSLP